MCQRVVPNPREVLHSCINVCVAVLTCKRLSVRWCLLALGYVQESRDSEDFTGAAHGSAEHDAVGYYGAILGVNNRVFTKVTGLECDSAEGTHWERYIQLSHYTSLRQC